MREVDLVLWDLDGCLIDSTRVITGCVVDALEAVGVPAPDPATLTWCVGPPLLESLRHLIVSAGADERLAEGCLDAYRERYAEVSLRDTTTIPGMPETLEAVGARTTMAVVTSKPAGAAARLLDHLGLRGAFVAVHAPDADHRIETKEQTLTRALAQLGRLAPGGGAGAVMVGDRSHDVLAGRACGTATVGVTWGAGTRDELSDAGADVIVDTPGQLRALLA